MREDPAMRRVVVLALPGVLPFELSIPGRVFGSAYDDDGRPLYEVRTCSVDGAPVPTLGDFALAVAHDLRALRRAGTIVVPAADLAYGRSPEWAEAVDALRARRPGVRVASICTGAELLARAGLLDGRPATTHWKHAAEFARDHPAVRVDPEVLYVDDGDVLTSAGAAAGIDLCLHLVRRDHGAEVANRVARACVVPPHRDGGQAQYIDHPVPEPAEASTAATRAWALRHLDGPLNLETLAAHAAMSVRTFTRRFRDEVGVSPNRWITHQRVELARRLLETTDLPVDRVAERAGVGTAASLRLHMGAVLGVSPSAYRRTFRAQPSAASTIRRSRSAPSPSARSASW